MGREGTQTAANSAYSDKIPSNFDGHSFFVSFHGYVQYWLQLTSLDPIKQRCALIARLAGEAKASAKSLGTEVIFSSCGVKKILEKLGSVYKVEKADELDIYFAEFLDYTCKSTYSAEQFIAGFFTRLDKIAELKWTTRSKDIFLFEKLK